MARSGIARHHIAAVACGGDYLFDRADIGAYGNMWNVVLSAFIAFLSNNVSTIVLAGIYLYQRDKINRRAELARMNVQDL